MNTSAPTVLLTSSFRARPSVKILFVGSSLPSFSHGNASTKRYIAGNTTTSIVSADARESVELFLLDRVDFEKLNLKEHFERELENRVQTLEDCGLFTGETLWNKQELRELAKVAMPLVFKRGSII